MKKEYCDLDYRFLEGGQRWVCQREWYQTVCMRGGKEMRKDEWQDVVVLQIVNKISV